MIRDPIVDIAIARMKHDRRKPIPANCSGCGAPQNGSGCDYCGRGKRSRALQRPPAVPSPRSDQQPLGKSGGMTRTHYFVVAAVALALFCALGQNPVDTSSNFGSGVVPKFLGLPVVGIVVIWFLLFVRKDTRR